MQINSILIVGGGSAGWFTASSLCKHCPEIQVTLIESPNVPTIGVGESTLGFINNFFRTLDMKDDEWMSACNATYKASIKFTDFYKKGETFHYPFGDMDFNYNNFRGDDWFYKKWVYPEISHEDFVDSYFPQMPLIRDSKIFFNTDNSIPVFDPNNDLAYQMDATLLGNWMKNNLCLPTGMKHILDHVTNVNLKKTGWIDSVSTKENGNLQADLYIDCTGFKSLLLGKALNVPFNSFEDVLINNHAWTTHLPYSLKDYEMEMTTNGTAIENGWVWNIPLWNRIGTGYVYSDKFIDKETALEEFKKHLNGPRMRVPKSNRVEEYDLEFKHIDIKNGRYEKLWHKNCLAIGLSGGFIEPLESTGLLLTHETVDKLIIILKSRDKHINEFDRSTLNMSMNQFLDNFKSFIVMHFILSHRDDTEYWKYYTQDVDFNKEGIIINLAKARMLAGTTRELGVGGVCIAVGEHLNILDDYVIQKACDRYSADKAMFTSKEDAKNQLQEVMSYWNTRTKMVQDIADQCPTMYEYLGKNLYNN